MTPLSALRGAAYLVRGAVEALNPVPSWNAAADRLYAETGRLSQIAHHVGRAVALLEDIRNLIASADGVRPSPVSPAPAAEGPAPADPEPVGAGHLLSRDDYMDLDRAVEKYWQGLQPAFQPHWQGLQTRVQGAALEASQ